MIVDDGTGDYFVIPVDKHDNWVKYLDDIWEDNPPQQPEWAHYFGGFPSMISFTDWKIIP